MKFIFYLGRKFLTFYIKWSRSISSIDHIKEFSIKTTLDIRKIDNGVLMKIYR